MDASAASTPSGGSDTSAADATAATSALGEDVEAIKAGPVPQPPRSPANKNEGENSPRVAAMEEVEKPRPRLATMRCAKPPRLTTIGGAVAQHARSKPTAIRAHAKARKGKGKGGARWAGWL